MINYEGISYNLETIIEFKSLKLLLEALAKKQIEHNILFYGKNININNINNNPDINKENNTNKTVINENKNEDEKNLEKILTEKINHDGLIKAFIESQKKLTEQNNIINDLKNRIDSLEKRPTRLREKKEAKKVIINKEDKSSEKIDINKVIEKPIVKEEKITSNEPKNTENKTITIYDTKTKTKINDSYGSIKLDKLEKQLISFEELINSLNERIDDLEQNVDNNINDIDMNKANISSLNEKMKHLNDKLRNLDGKKNNEISITVPEKEVLIEEKKPEEKMNTINSNNDDKIVSLENELNLFETKITKMFDEKMKELKRNKSDSNIMKEINGDREKLKEINDKFMHEISKLKKKEEDIEDKLKEFVHYSEIKKINEKIKILEQDMEEFATKNDIKHVLSEIDKYEKELIKFKSFNVNQKEINAKNRDDIGKLKNSFATLKQNFSALNSLFENNSLSSLIENLNNISENFLEKEEYNNEMKNINKKITEMQMDVNEHNRNFGEILPKIQNLVDIYTFNKLQRTIDELILNGVKEGGNKSLDTDEIIKNIKAMESQVKLFMKKLETDNEKEKIQNDNCILASRPIGGFKCASCETYIGDIKENNVYLPWNKYQGDIRPYRLGSSFSRILQGLNIEQNFNPFIHKKNFLRSENDKRYQITNESLSVKKVRKIPPLSQINYTEQNNEKKNNSKGNINFNKTIDENKNKNDYSGSGFLHNNKMKKKLNVNLWGIKSLKNFGNDKNILTLNIQNKSKNKNNNRNNSFNRDNNKNIIEEKVIKITRKSKVNKINNSEDNENHLVIPNL